MKSILFCLLFTAASHSQIVLSEIMFNPKGDERTLEYIELFNKSKTTSLSLKNHMLTDGQGVDQITTVTGELSLQPEQFALVLSPTYYEKSTAYDSIVPPETLWLTIHNSQFGAYGLNNSKGEPVSLLSPDSSVLSSYTYTVDNDDGISDEKIDLYGSDAADNWGNSQPGGTPGFLNSISPASHDLSLEYIDHFPAPCSDQDSVTILILLTNKGLHAIEYIDLIVEIRSDTTEPHGSPIYQSRLTNRIPISDSVRNTIKLSPFEPGRYDLKIKANTEKDDRLSNNSINLKLLCYPLFSPKDILINEIYFDPAPDSSEWVELYNNSGQTINLCNWTFSDSRTRIRVQESIQFLSGEYILLGSSPFDRDRLKWIECNLPALNNPGDNLTLQNPVGTVIDSLKYQSNWGGGDGISLERIEFSGASTDPDNWRGCTDSSGHTAGRYNSNSPKQYDLEIKSSFWQPEAPSHNTPVYLNAVILNVGRSTLSGITVEWSAQSCADQHPHRIGIYTIPSLAPKDSATAGIRWNHAMPGSYHLTAAVHHSSDSNLVNNILTDTISISAPALSAVVTEILYNPDDKMSESIELYNRSPHPLELSGWTLTDSDSLSPLSFAVNNYLLPSNHYCVICRDSSAAKANTDSWIVSLILPNLNNTNDLIKLSDANGRMMDSLIYHSEWGGEKGRSLERIHANLDSNDPHNWSTCLHPDGHTLGKVNSNYIPVTSRPVTLTAEPNPFSPNQDGIDDHTIIQYHLSRPAELINLKIYDIQGRLVRFLRNNDKSPIEHYAVWDGKDDSGQRCRMGIYIILLEALNTSGKTIDRKKSTVVLADKL